MDDRVDDLGPDRRSEDSRDGIWAMTVVTVGAEHADLVAEMLRDLGADAVEIRDCPGSGDGLEQRVELWSPAPVPDAWAADIARLCGAPVAVRVDEIARSVADRWRDHAGPTVVGPLILVPAWKDAHDIGVRSPVLIDPEHLFGLGDHPTTRGILEMALSSGPAGRIVDAGCGSGVLGIALAVAARRLGEEPPEILGFDVAPGTRDAVARNCRRNGVDTFQVVDATDIADQWSHLTLANILAPALRELAPTLERITAPGGQILLAGIRPDQRDEVVRAFRRSMVLEESTLHGWCVVRLTAGAGESRVN